MTSKPKICDSEMFNIFLKAFLIYTNEQQFTKIRCTVVKYDGLWSQNSASATFNVLPTSGYFIVMSPGFATITQEVNNTCFRVGVWLK